MERFLVWSVGLEITKFVAFSHICVYTKCHAMLPQTMLAAGFKPGSPEGMFTANVPLPNLRSGEVMIKVYTSALNRADTLQRQGRYPPPPGESAILGLEAAGVVVDLHAGCSKKWKVGDKVMALLNGGGNAEFVAVHEDLVMPLSDAMSFAQAAAIPEVWLTAFQLLHLVGKVQAGDSVLIHAGGSGVGTAAIQLAKMAGAQVLVTAGTSAKLDKAKELGADVVVNYKQTSFAQPVLDATMGKGVNLVLDCVGSTFYGQNVEVLATDGRWVIYGLMGGGEVSGDILLKILRKRLTITGTTLRTRSREYKAGLVQRFTDEILPAITSGQLKTIIDSEFSLQNIGQAHAYMESNKNLGKIIVRVRDEQHDEL